MQIGGSKEVDALLSECTKRIELGSSIVPELEEMARHGEYLSKIIRDKLTALDKARELAVDRRQSSTAASRTPPISEQQALSNEQATTNKLGDRLAMKRAPIRATSHLEVYTTQLQSNHVREEDPTDELDDVREFSVFSRSQSP